MDGVLGYLTVPDLKSCRLVSTQYNEIACKALQSEETITFRTISQLETYLSNIKPISRRTNLHSHHQNQHHQFNYPASLYSSSDLSSLSLADNDHELGEVDSDGEFYGFGEKTGMLAGGSETDLEDESVEHGDRYNGAGAIDDDGDDSWPYFDNNSSSNETTTLNYQFGSCGGGGDHGFSGGNYFLCCHDLNQEEGEECSNCYLNPYRYSHRSFHFDYCDPSEEIEPVEQFFSRFGPQIKRLKYTTDLLPYNFPRPLCHMGEVWQDRLSNLEELSLEIKWGMPVSI